MHSEWQLLVSVTAKMKDSVLGVCEQERVTVSAYLAELIQRDIASRREAGWNPREGWQGRKKLAAMRAASFPETPPQA